VRHLVDPVLLPGLDFMPGFEFSPEALPAIRQGVDQAIAAAPEPQDTGVAWRDDQVASPAGHAVPVRVYTPAGVKGPLPLIVLIHGGGYVMGSHRLSHAANLAMAAATETVIVAVDYRLAPETVAPGSVEDCYAALCWAVERAETLGIDAARVAVRGESAGGGLAAALCQLARDRAGPAIIHQNLIYPMLDDRTCITRQPDHLGAFVWTPQANAFGWRSLLGMEPGGASVPPYAAAARAESLAGLPPAFIAVGALDLFLAEDMDYARRLIEAGIATELHVYAGAYHGFDVLPDAEPVLRMKRDAIAALRRALHPA
jgi:triacylglycerol lipase